MTLPGWARAHGAPLFSAAIRQRPEDFQVSEELGWALSDDGEHDYLLIEKTGANTEWVARQLARLAEVPARDVGYAGLKDRHAVTTQWFSVPRRQAPDWTSLDVEGVVVLETRRHAKKLRRGAHRGNAFRVVLRGEGIADHADALATRVAAIREQGVPNYFGEQRFGREGGNLRLANDWAAGKRLPRHKRGIAISTIRSFLFNEALSARVSDGSWNRIRPGDTVNLDGTGSVFVADDVDAELERRCAGMDVHPAGVLAGQGHDAGPETWRAALDRARVETGARSLRLRVSGITFSLEDDAVILTFALGRGAFATAVLQEIADT